MTINDSETEDFVTRWLSQAKAEGALNQDMVGLLSNQHQTGNNDDEESIYRALLKLPAKSEASSDIH